MAIAKFVELATTRERELPSLGRLLLPIILIFLNTTLTALEFHNSMYVFLPELRNDFKK